MIVIPKKLFGVALAGKSTLILINTISNDYALALLSIYQGRNFTLKQLLLLNRYTLINVTDLPAAGRFTDYQYSSIY